MADVTINDLTGQAPVLTDVFPFSTSGITPSTYKATLQQIKTALSIPAAQVNSDWNATTGVAQILNKPTIPTQSIAQAIFNRDNVTTSIAGGAYYLDTNITIPSGSKVLINARITMSGSGANVFTVNFVRNSTVIDIATNDSYGYTENITFALIDNPGPGTHTYRFQNQSTGGGARNINRDSSGNSPCYSTILLQEIRGV